jgi:PAS domain S-box-containing protein
MATAVSRAVIEVLLDRVNQGAATLSPEGKVVYANQRLASMLGVTRAQLAGKALSELVAEAEREALESALAGSRDGAAQCRVALRRRSDGNGGGGELHVQLTFAPLGHGHSSCLVTDAAAGRHAAALVHEVRNMLGTIRNSAELLRRTAPDPDSQRVVAAMERHSARILELLNARE